MELVYYLGINTIFMATTITIASLKGRDVITWSIMGFLFGPISFIVLLCVSDLVKAQRKKEAIEKQQLRKQLLQLKKEYDQLKQEMDARRDTQSSMSAPDPQAET